MKIITEVKKMIHIVLSEHDGINSTTLQLEG